VLARQTYLDAWTAALFAGEFAKAGNLHEVSRAARSAPPASNPPAPHDLLLDSLAVLVTDGLAAAASMLRRAVRIFAADEIAVEERLRWGWPAALGASVLWDMESFHSIMLRQLQSARDAGLLVRLLVYVHGLGLCINPRARPGRADWSRGLTRVPARVFTGSRLGEVGWHRACYGPGRLTPLSW
jgi:hypothetical protein